VSSWTPPFLSKKQVLSIASLLDEEIAKIRAVREELVQHNLRLVVWVAKSYRGRGMDLVDLIQEGSMGLLRAIDRFDPAVGTRFSTFATHWVRQGISRALAEKARMIRIPLNRLPEVRETMTTQSRLSEKLSRPPTVEEIAEEMHADSEKIKDLLPALSPMDSIDAPLPGTDLYQYETLADESSASPFERAAEEEKVSSVQRLLTRLPDRQRRILAMRYGIGYPKESTLEEIGMALGLSRERIRQIEKVACNEFKKGWAASDDT
jgi:RNA polymerase sigma factor (sigma-70 family)